MDYDGSAIEECIRFNSVTFIYDKSKPVDSDHEVEESGAPVLNNLNLSLRKGCKVALVETSGCGKSTVLKLITGFNEIKTGPIDFLGQDRSKCNLHAMRDKLSYVSQETIC